MLKGKKNDFKQTASAWVKLSPPLTVIKNERQFKRAVEFLDYLVDEVRDSSSHALAPLLEVVGVLIESYEREKVLIPEGSALDTLKFLMKEHSIAQKDLIEIGSQGVVSEILRGRRKLNTRQIAALSKRFNVSPSVFF